MSEVLKCSGQMLRPVSRVADGAGALALEVSGAADLERAVTNPSGGNLIVAAAAASPVGKLAKGRLLFRFGTRAESAAELGEQAARAEARGFGHGVSTTTRRPTRTEASTASRDAVEQHFGVVQTGADPAHHTVVLPKPVTEQVADVFNRLFGRTP
jgi:hypothetical protein